MVNSYLMHRRKAFRGQPSPLLTNLVAWYRLDEASGNALDAHTGAYHLTQNGTVGTATGKVSGARSFDANSSNFLSQSGSQFNFGNTTFYGAQWIYSGNTNTAIIHGVWDDGVGANRQWFLFQDASRYRFGITSDGLFGAGNGLTVAWGSNFAINTWHLVEFYHNAATDLIGIAVNNGAFVTGSFNKGIYVGASTPYRVGRGANNSAPLAWNGRLDEVAIWSRMLTTDERATLWNSGNGIGYSA